jgi:hypothetical protein
LTESSGSAWNVPDSPPTSRRQYKLAEPANRLVVRQLEKDWGGRVEDAIRTGRDAGLGHSPSFDFQINAAWITAAMTGPILLAWLKLLALDGDLARAEPRTLRYQILHAAAPLIRSGRRRP